MSNYKITDDSATVDRLSQQRDDIYDYVVERFRYHMANDNIDEALALADEFFEWMDPDNMEKEETAFYNEDDLLNLYLSLPENYGGL
ncbi:hypothetical protein ABY41_gp056 [Synechococcus phage ACG-2014i]|jgi:hypothetical protein|uniref:Uncharacterized protein n=1 Tax=Synechococcus phage ACG-2014i TaxID=1493513 RepID=A0A0E3HGF2_9CAUD|nr:hypothetical protein ABY41_gp056 [Synechococcus phage ACG-2014i]AIX26777.1 hypothetical protein Syn7803US120_56 [Synechococcus phage ACG-2014i]